jgi:hypothetical protein
MIELKPNLMQGYTCPICGTELVATDFLITGMRTLVEGSCKLCKKDFITDMPTGFGLYYPTTIELDSKKVFDPVNVKWHSDLLLNSLENKIEHEVNLNIIKFKEIAEIIIINCLDFLYGHALLKLFNLQYYLDTYKSKGICVLIPKQFRILVPDGVSEIWEVDMPLKELRLWHTQLDKKIHEEVYKRKKCYLGVCFTHPIAGSFDINRFVKTNSNNLHFMKPVFVFIYREDRLWGRSMNKQLKNINNLCTLLKNYYTDITFIVTGITKDKKSRNRLFANKIHNAIINETTDKPSVNHEKLWLDIYSVADCVIGVHGSNMILPSALAESIVELLPESRYSNIFQEYLPTTNDEYHLENLYRFRTVYGNETLDDISPKRIFLIVKSLIDGKMRFKDYMGKEFQDRSYYEEKPDRLKEITDHFLKC